LNTKLARFAPPGLELKQEFQFFVIGTICAALYSLSFLIRFTDALSQLYWRNGLERTLIPDAVMPDFRELLGSSLAGFLVIGLCMIPFALYHYAYHRQGSKSIYLMRRLPDRWELHRRCLTLPALGAVICLILALLLLLLYFAIYLLATPDACLTPDQWQKLWRWNA
jgi:hypothetical protein